MWHEARRQEKLIRSQMIDSVKRNERRKQFYENVVSIPYLFPGGLLGLGSGAGGGKHSKGERVKLEGQLCQPFSSPWKMLKSLAKRKAALLCHSRRDAEAHGYGPNDSTFISCYLLAWPLLPWIA